MSMFTPQDIRAFRLELGLTPTQFAAKIGVSASSVCLWESGERHPRYKTMEALNQLRDKMKAKRQPAAR